MAFALERGLKWLELNRENEVIEEEVLSWMLHIYLKQFRIDKLSAVNAEIREEHREAALKVTAGHVEARKTEFRKISQQCHQFLDSLPASLLGRKRPLSNVTNSFDQPLKQFRIHDVAKAGESDSSDQWIF